MFKDVPDTAGIIIICEVSLWITYSQCGFQRIGSKFGRHVRIMIMRCIEGGLVKLKVGW